ncbi:hypothetical protein BJX68DRAFT_30534 [Aspergillus pseudodeflectus]|uniref:Nephrocystin 3-like N-terminal domain-containing protein n=1 Tax=Aspergillus pseudodeflectus TaxID=176178 RepID=A0ABR4KQQ7_9EURO
MLHHSKRQGSKSSKYQHCFNANTAEVFVYGQRRKAMIAIGSRMPIAGIAHEKVRSSILGQKEKHDKLIYFYFSFNDPNRQDLSGFLRSALAQLCVDDIALDLVEAVCHWHSASQPFVQILMSTFLEALDLDTKASQGGTASGARSGKTYIILDGLDEIPYGPKRSRVLKFLDGISRLQNPQVHMIACSREE